MSDTDSIKKTLDEQVKQGSSHVCPHCGYCPHCGRGGYYPAPMPYYPRPWWGGYWYDYDPRPMTITWGGLTGPVGGTTYNSGRY
jgi:hypothetical protein